MPKDKKQKKEKKEDPKRAPRQQARHWSITLNPIGEIPANDPPEFDAHSMYYMEWVKHQATHVHYHVYVHFKNVRDLSVIRAWLMHSPKPNYGLNCEPTKSVADWLCYIGDGHTTIAGPFKFGSFSHISSGYRTDIEQAMAMASQGMTASDIKAERPSLHRIYKAIDRMVQDSHKPCEKIRVSAILWGVPNIGKSSRVFAKYGYDNVFVYRPMESFPFDGYHGQRVVLFEDLNHYHSLDVCKSLLDITTRYVNIKGGLFPASYEVVVFTSNFDPSTYWPKAPDRQKFFSRIDLIVNVTSFDMPHEVFPPEVNHPEKAQF